MDSLRLALVVFPLALTISAIPASAGLLVHLGSGSNCTVSPLLQDGTCSTYQPSLQGADPNMNWVALEGQTSLSFTSGGVTFSANGTGNGGFLPASSIPVAWDFFIDSVISAGLDIAQAPPVAWNLHFTLDTLNSGPFSFSTGGSVQRGTEVTGSGTIDVLSSDEIIGYSISLSANSSFQYAVDIPANSTLDLNVLAAPEPGTFVLTTAAGALLFLRLKKRA